jgi:hypothetical protein
MLGISYWYHLCLVESLPLDLFFFFLHLLLDKFKNFFIPDKQEKKSCMTSKYDKQTLHTLLIFYAKDYKNNLYGLLLYIR